jgi:hypothetical protein
MRNRRLLSIDLGTAYTKIAVRRNWDDEVDALAVDTRANHEDRFCIPSVVACTNRNGSDHWLFFREAADSVSGETTKVFRYWKPKMFQGPAVSGEALEIAPRYLAALRERLARIDPGLADYPVRLCVPKLREENGLEDTIGLILREAGWPAAEGSCYVYEPTANACGLLTRGRNRTWSPPPKDFQRYLGRQCNLSEMLDRGGLLRWLQAMNEQYRVLVIDVGAFTTDFGLVEFNARFNRHDRRWRFDRIAQESAPVGIRDLDKLLFDRLSEDQQEAVRHASTRQWEDRKRLIYSGQAAAFKNPNGGRITIGGEVDQETVEGAIKDFTELIVLALEKFQETESHGRIHAYMITGGGLNIKLVREAVLGKLAKRQSGRFLDLMDETEPENAGLTLQREIEARRRQNRTLVRGASAIGGASVFFE